MLLGLCLGAMCNAWMKHAMTSSWVIAPAPVACMTCLSAKVNPSVQVGIVQLQRILYHWRKVIPQRTNCADSVIRSETLIDYIHAHMRALIGFRQPQPTEQQTDPHESQNLLRWPRNSITVKLQQVAEKAETHTRWWYRETIAVCPECSEAAAKIQQKVASNDINLNRSIVKSCSKRNTKWWAYPCREGLPTSFLP